MNDERIIIIIIIIIIISPRKTDHLKNPGVCRRKRDVGAWTGSSWLRIGTGGRHLGMGQ